MQTTIHCINGCSRGKLPGVNGKPWGVSMEQFYILPESDCCKSCIKILANEWEAIPETTLEMVHTSEGKSKKKYLILRIKEIGLYLTPEERAQLWELLAKIQASRKPA